MRRWTTGALLGALLALAGCGPTITVHHKVDPIFVNVTINHKVQRDLEEVFEFETARGELVDARSTPRPPAPATAASCGRRAAPRRGGRSGAPPTGS